MKVSIVIPVYNAENYLDECIKSALSQSYSDVEIIAVNDGSTDNSQPILNNYKNEITIINKKNGGTASALNVGIKRMNGEWFKWLSADDILKPNSVKILCDEAEKLGNKSYSNIIYSNYDIIDESGKIIDSYNEPNHNDLESFQRNVILLDHFYGNGDTTLIHKSVFEKCGNFNEKIRFKDDYEFWLRCCMIFGLKLHLVAQNTASYRVHKNQLTKTKFHYSLEQIQQIKVLILNKLSDEIKSKYLLELKKYQKQKPFDVKARILIRNLMFKSLPKNLSNFILKKYLANKELKK
jgi:glycosyltransferase involved in cell wall biosynthesis